MRHKQALAVWLLSLVAFSSRHVQHAASQGGPGLSIQGLTLFSTTAYQWSVTKSSSVSSISIQQGASGSADFTVAFIRTAGPPVFTVQGQVLVSNPWTSQLQLSGIDVQVQYPSSSSSSQAGPIAATVTCPASQTLSGILLVPPAAPASAASGQLLCNFTVTLPSSDQGYVIAQANTYGSAAAAGPLISQPVAFDFSSTMVLQPASSVGECALVSDTFDPLSYQALGPPTITQGLKPPGNGEVLAQLCDSRTYTYTAQWSVPSQAACGTFVIASTATADPQDGSSQLSQAATAYLEVDACNSQEQALPPPATDAAVSDDSGPQIDVTVISTTGGGTAYTWGVANSVSSPANQVHKNSSSNTVTFAAGFTRIPGSAPAPLTITGVITVTNPTGEAMVISEVEASYVAAAAAGSQQQQQVDTAASCPTSVGGVISIDPNSYATCYFTVLFNGQQGGSIWGAAVTADGVQSQSTQVTVPPSSSDTATDVGGCAMVSATFLTGGAGQIVPVAFASGSQVPPPSSSPQQICATTMFTFTGEFGPFASCGALTATSSASVNPVGGQQSTQSASATASFTVLC